MSDCTGRQGLIVSALIALAASSGAAEGRNQPEAAGKKEKPEFPPFAEVAKGYEKVVSRADDAGSLYTIYVDKKKQQMLAELKRGFEGQKIFVATSIAGGSRQTGWQWRERYCYWTRHDKKLVLMEPQLLRQARGGKQDEELKLAVQRTYNDRVVTSVPILTMGPNRGPVIDLDELLIRKSQLFTHMSGDASLAKIGHIKAFPHNLEIPVTIPMDAGEMTTLHYSISVIPKTDFQPRASDDRIGYFLTVFRDLTMMSPDGANFVRYVNRWNLKKRDPELALSPPVAPIVFYIEHTVPVRYRRFVREGILEWNKAFEKVGILNAIEVRQQDARTGAFMDIAPEDVRYNFFRWISSERAFAMGPSRVNPETGEILDADIIFDDSMLKYYALRYKQRIAAYGLDGVDPEALRWIQEHPRWNPLVRYERADPAREAILANPQLTDEQKADFLGLPHPPGADELLTRVVQQNRYCSYASGKAMQMQTAGLAMRLLADRLFDEADGDGGSDDVARIDGVPEDYLGAILKETVMHEVGHTLGLRHNFKASSWLTLEKYAGRTGEANVGSVMDYNPIHVPPQPGQPRGDWVTPTIGPYDYWAIDYGYTLDEKRGREILKQVANRELQYATDEDTWGPDPLVARFDLGAEPLEWAEMRLELVKAMRGKLLEGAVEDGQSWHLLRQAYEILLGEQLGALRLASRYLGGVHIHRDHKGDPDARNPLVPTDAETQRRALRFVIDNAFRDGAFDTRPEVLGKLATDKHRHWGSFGSGDEAFSIHDRIAQIQSFALLYLLNPGTLTRVYDNELRIRPDDDAFTLPELMGGSVDAVFGELDAPLEGAGFTNRRPMISSLRRNLQSEMAERLIDLAMDGHGMPRPIQTLARSHLKQIDAKLDAVLDRADTGQIDDYTLVHLADLRDRIDKALNAVHVTGSLKQTLHLGGVIFSY
ncbi:MAG: zinc-dependent metalloprotease [Planctomycetota bacterium]|jgi:hypothetical protein